ncbi:MAG: LuxR family transcriptional regulator [Ekhidna sp.]|uniref:helix-turn-helix transcriptional regulator n=1 Tax=Ekhidna sp. TaxID=2608089 RepID=UPI0032F08C65
MKKLYFILLLVTLGALPQLRGQSLDQILLQLDSLSNPNSMLSILNPYLESIDGADESTQIKYFYHLGIAHGMLYNTDTSAFYFAESLKLAEANNDLISQIGALNGLGNVARITSENDQAKTYFERALNIAKSKESEEFKSWQSKLLGNIAGIFFELGDPESALEYSKMGLVLSREINDQKAVATNLIRLGYCFNALQKLDSALLVNQEATGILESSGDSLGLIYQYYSMANIYQTKQDFEEAEKYFKRAIDLSSKFGEAETHTGSLNQLAEIEIKRGNFGRSQKLLDDAIEISEKNGMLFGLRKSYQLYYQLNRLQNDWVSAVENLERYHALNDSIQKTETLKNVEEFKVKYETAEKEKEILEARQELERKERFQTFLLIVIGIIVVFSIVAILLLVQRFRLRRALHSQEIDTLRLQINSIFEGGIKNLDVELDQINEGLFKPLSEREFEVLNQAISDKTNSEIADALFLSVNTVKFHLRNVYEKLGVTNRKEALGKILSKA